MLKQKSFTTKWIHQRQQIMFKGGWAHPSCREQNNPASDKSNIFGAESYQIVPPGIFMNFSFERSTRTNHSHESLARILLNQCVYPIPIGPISTKWVGLWYIYKKHLLKQCVYPTLKAAHHYKMSWPMMWLQQACSQAMCLPHSYNGPSL